MNPDKFSLAFSVISTTSLSIWGFTHANPIVAIGICANGLSLCLAIIRLIWGETK